MARFNRWIGLRTTIEKSNSRSILSRGQKGVKEPMQPAVHGRSGFDSSDNDAVSVFSTGLGWVGLVGAGDVVQAVTFGHETPVEVLRSLPHPRRPVDELPQRDWSPSLRKRLEAYAAGERCDFSDVPVRLDHLTGFQQAVIGIVRTIAYGATMSYGEVAVSAGFPRAARAVGQVMASNPAPLIVPCHRVLAAAGRLGGFSAPCGPKMKERLLALERGDPSLSTGTASSARGRKTSSRCVEPGGGVLQASDVPFS